MLLPQKERFRQGRFNINSSLILRFTACLAFAKTRCFPSNGDAGTEGESVVSAGWKFPIGLGKRVGEVHPSCLTFVKIGF
jgi:hypothetical protein